MTITTGKLAVFQLEKTKEDTSKHISQNAVFYIYSDISVEVKNQYYKKNE